MHQFNPLTLYDMKKYVSILLILFAIMLTETGCESNTPDEQKRGGETTEVETNQPADPATWSPEGKTYVRDRSGVGNNAYDYEEFWEVITFQDDIHAVWYGTIHADLTPMEDYYNEARYQLNYPNLTLTFGIDKDEYIFKDTLTLSCVTSQAGDYSLLDANNR